MVIAADMTSAPSPTTTRSSWSTTAVATTPRCARRVEAVLPSSQSGSPREEPGLRWALRTGFATATKDLVFYTDGDAQYDPRELELLLQAMGPGVDLVNGYKVKRSDPLHRIVIGRMYHWMVRTAFGYR